ncbi:RNA-binding protein [bacterium BMS3Abin03]|jgi:RNA recognition motif-containing protein|nr:RNA-binding protein [bacterium BMS3Abin03]MCG6959612.1 RNA-binding protein [bacterium BMS3Abin03]
MKIFVGNLSYEVEDRDLTILFSKFGKVSSVKIIRNIFSQTSRGYGFVDMPWVIEAQKALENLNKYEFMGKNLIVNEAKPILD